MRKIYLLLGLLSLYNTASAQQKTTGTVTLLPLLTAKIDLDDATSTVTLTLTGPKNRFFALGFDAVEMEANTDVVVMTSATAFSDMTLPGGHVAPAADTTNNWTIISNDEVGTSRTVVASRPFVAETSDFTFAYSMTSINLIFSHRNTSGYTLNGHSDNFGSTNVTFTDVLGNTDFNLLSNVTVSPNPSNGIFTISKNSQTPISAVKVYDINAKMIREVKFGTNQEINLSDLNQGMYFLEISNDIDKVVKKVFIN